MMQSFPPRQIGVSDLAHRLAGRGDIHCRDPTSTASTTPDGRQNGFEIDFEGVTSSHVTDTFGGAGGGFPTTVEPYGAPTVKDVTFADGATRVASVHKRTFENPTNSWNVGTPSAVYFTPGEEFLDRRRIETWRRHTFDRLGVGTSKTPTKTNKTNNRLTETAPNSPIFSNGKHSRAGADRDAAASRSGAPPGSCFRPR